MQEPWEYIKEKNFQMKRANKKKKKKKEKEIRTKTVSRKKERTMCIFA